jgi:hypothetical protein
VITIGKTVGLPEEFLSSSFVEASASFLAKRHVSDVEIGIASPNLPVRPLVSLNALVRPIPAILRFNNIEFTIESESHYRMTCMGSRAVHNDGVNTIKASN